MIFGKNSETAFYHDYTDVQPKGGHCYSFTLHQSNDIRHIEKIWLRVLPDNEQQFIEMLRTDNTWYAECDIYQPVMSYRFGILVEGRLLWFNRWGIQESNPLDLYDFKILSEYRRLDWLHTSVFYQIFPDAYANPGGQSQKDTSDALKYYGREPHYVQPNEDIPTDIEPWFIFHGGRFCDIQDSIPELEKLGVNALYVNPVFSAYTSHKYDAINYEVDIDLGGRAGLQKLVSCLHQRGFKIILDVVPNHCGALHEWFQTAVQNSESEERGFFKFSGDDSDDYYCWLGVKSLPKFDYSSEELKKRMYKNQDSLLLKFLKSAQNSVTKNEYIGIDGWRVDVGNMIGYMGAQNIHRQLCSEMAAAVKSVNPDAYFMGEHYFDASEDLQGSIFDGVMNYSGFRFPLIAWLTVNTESVFANDNVIQARKPLSTAAFIETLCARYYAIPEVIALQQYNLLSSHDTSRIASILDKIDLVLAVVLQFTLPGVPAIYYGDEFATIDDPVLGSRNLPDLQGDSVIYELHRSLIKLRKKHASLQSGSMRVLAYSDDAFAFIRARNDMRAFAIVGINKGDSEVHLELADDFFKPIWIDNVNERSSLYLKPKSACIFVCKDGEWSEYNFTYSTKM